MSPIITTLAATAAATLLGGLGHLIKRAKSGGREDAALVTHSALEAVQAIDTSLKAVQEERVRNQEIIGRQSRVIARQAARIADLEGEVRSLGAEVKRLSAIAGT